MPFMRYSYATVVAPHVTRSQWGKIRTASLVSKVGGKLDENLVTRASGMFDKPFTPDAYLLTHATIIASVDTFSPPGTKTGAVLVDGFRTNRRYAAYRVEPTTAKYINNNCLVPGTPVMMSDGTVKPIEDVKMGDEVITHLGRVRKVKETFRHDVNGLLYEIKVRGTNERIYVTEDHPFFVFRSNAECVECGAPIRRATQAVSHLLGRHYCSKECFYKRGVPNRRLLQEKKGEFIPAKELRIGDFTTVPVLSDTVPVELSLARARLVGLFLAEGFYELDSRNGNEKVGVAWAFHENETDTLAATVCALMKSEFGSNCVIRKHSADKGIVVSTNVDRNAVQFFSSMVLGEHSKDKRLRADLLRAPREVQIEIVRGWLDGDGSAFNTGTDDACGDFRVVGTTASRGLASQMTVLFHRLGIAPHLTHNETEGRRRLVIDGSVKIVPDSTKTYHSWSLSCGAGWVSELVETTRFEDAYEKAMELRGGVQKVPTLRFLNDHCLQMVTSVLPVDYSGPVYNFETEEDHSYVAGGVAVHNSDAWSRPVLLKAHRTFVGGHNFVEHVQVEELSKGRIIDAVARDIGDSIYVDILIATDRKHKDLIEAIENGRMGTLSMGCFLPGTQVSMADGRRISIEDVQPGDMVLTHKGRSREVLNKQIRIGEWGVRHIKAVGIPTTVTATDNHPFLAFRPATACACGCGGALPEYKGGRKNATRALGRKFLSGHDKRLFNPNGIYSLEEAKARKERVTALKTVKPVWVRADEIRPGDFLCFPRIESGTAGVTEGKARLLGFFLAEGCFAKYKGVLTETQFCFSLAERDTFAAETVSLLQKEFGAVPWTQDRPDRNTCTVHVSGKEIAAWFMTHGGEYGNRKRLSPEVMAWTTANHKTLIGAWLDGDGHLSVVNGNTIGTTTSYDLACQMHALSAKCGWFARLECKVGAHTVELREVVNGGFVRDEVSGRLPSFNLVVGKTHGPVLSRHTVKASVETGFGSQGLRVRDDLIMFPVTSVDAGTWSGPVHNMEVAEDNSYIVEGMAVHNCTVDGTICTKCGHWAADETEMCPHVKYEKGNTFFDEQGRKHIVAELCGHESLDPNGGVMFIEASWVEQPAFTGAVLRNVIKPTDEIVRLAQHALKTPPPQWTADSYLKAARQVKVSDGVVATPALATADMTAGGRRTLVTAETPDSESSVWAGGDPFLAGWGESEEPGGGSGEGATPAPAPAAPAAPFKDVEDELEKHLLDRVVKRVRDKIKDENVENTLNPNPSSAHTEENVVKEGRLYRAGLEAIVKKASSDADLIDSVAAFNRAAGVEIPVEFYRAALAVGPADRHPNVRSFLASCADKLGRAPNVHEAKTMMRLCKLLARGLVSSERFPKAVAQSTGGAHNDNEA